MTTHFSRRALIAGEGASGPRQKRARQEACPQLSRPTALTVTSFSRPALSGQGCPRSVKSRTAYSVSPITNHELPLTFLYVFPNNLGGTPIQYSPCLNDHFVNVQTKDRFANLLDETVTGILICTNFPLFFSFL